LRKILHILLHLTKRKAKSSITPPTPIETDAPQLSMFPSIHKLPLIIFIDTLIDKVYDRVGGQSEWERLFNEYTELIGGKELTNKLDIVKETIILQSRMQRAKGLLELISIRPNEDLYNAMYDFDYPLPGKVPYTMDAMNKTLKTFIAHYKRELIDLHESATQLENQGTDNGVLDYQYFMTIIVDMSTVFKMTIDINSINVGQYCIFVNRYKEHCEHIKKQAE